MFYYMYRITNLLNGKIYIGVHKTENLDDGYMGSGVVLKQAQAKYGISNFKKEILEFFGSVEEMFLREAEVVTKDFVLQETNYNLATGGQWPGVEAVRSGGFAASSSGAQRKGGTRTKELGKGIFSKESREKVREWNTSARNLEALRSRAALIASSEDIKKKRKQTLASIGHQQGEKNSAYGTHWITNGTESKRVDKLLPIPEGWKKGRIIKSRD